MKNIFLIAFLVFGMSAWAQEINMDLGNFTKAKITQGLMVNFVEARANKAVITGTNREKVDITVEDGILDISITVKHIWKEDDTKITVYYKQIQEVEARQNSEVTITSNIKQPIIMLSVQEGSELTAKLNVENLIAKISTGADLNLTGKADSQSIDIRAAGEFKGENLVGQKVDVNIIGGGSANVNAREYVKATTKAGGNIYIYGNPKSIDQGTTFGGTIKKIN